MNNFRNLIAPLLSSAVLFTACAQNETEIDGVYQIVSQTAKVEVSDELALETANDFVYEQDFELNFENEIEVEGGNIKMLYDPFVQPEISFDRNNKLIASESKFNHKNCYSTIPIVRDPKNPEHPKDLWSRRATLDELHIIYVKFTKKGKLISGEVDISDSAGRDFATIKKKVSKQKMTYSQLAEELHKIDPSDATFKEIGVISSNDTEENTPFDLDVNKKSNSKVYVFVLANKNIVQFQRKVPFKTSLPFGYLYSPYTTYIPGVKVRNSSGELEHKPYNNIIVAEFFRGGNIRRRIEDLAKDRGVTPDKIRCSYPYDLVVRIKGQQKTFTPVIIDPRNTSQGPPFP